MSERQCGECNLCCKVLRVVDPLVNFDKPANVWCPHVELGKGCTIYDTRPKPCQEFKCLWLLNLVGDKWHPLKTKVVAAIGSSKFGETVYLYEDVEGNAKRYFNQHIEGWTYNGFTVIIIFKEKDRVVILGNPLRRKLQ